MYSHSDIDLNVEAALRLIAEPGDFAGDLQPGLDRAAHVVLVRDRIAEDDQQSIAFGRSDVAFVPLNDAQNLVAIPTDQKAIGLRFDLGG